MIGSSSGNRNKRVRNGAYISGIIDASNPDALSRDGLTICEQVRTSTVSDLIFWAVEISPIGDLYYNGVPLAQNGALTSSGTVIKDMISTIAGRETDDDRSSSPSSDLANVWFSLTLMSGGIYKVGQEHFNDILMIKLLLEPYNPNSDNFIRNLKTLQSEMPLFAGFDLDFEYPNGPKGMDAGIRNDEIISDLTATIWERLRCPVTYCTYNAPSEWIECAKKARRKTGTQPVAGFNVQCYGGGGGNASVSVLTKAWVEAVVDCQVELGLFEPLDFIWPVYSCKDPSGSFPTMSPDDVRSLVQRAGVRGASIWNAANIVAAGPGPVLADYSCSIAQAMQAAAFETMRGVVQFSDAEWSNQIHRINGASIEQAYDYALQNPDVSYFFRIDDGSTLFLRRHGVFRSGDSVFFSGEPCWATALGVATGYRRTAQEECSDTDIPCLPGMASNRSSCRSSAGGHSSAGSSTTLRPHGNGPQ